MAMIYSEWLIVALFPSGDKASGFCDKAPETFIDDEFAR
jgi:hypothetical protein